MTGPAARWLAAPLLGGVATLGFAPFGQWYLTIIALAALFALAAREAPLRAAGLAGLFGLVHYATGLYWVYISTHIYGGAPAWVAVFLALLLCTALAAHLALVVGVAARFGWLPGRAGWIAVPALWTLVELVRGHLVFGGLPWFNLGELSVDTPLVRLAAITGVFGPSAVIAAMAYALYRLGIARSTPPRIVAVAILVAPALSFLLPSPSSWTEPDGEPLTVALVQSDIRQDQKWLPHMRTEALARHWRLTQQAWPADLVVWPEVALTQPYHQLENGYLDRLGEEVAARNATVLLGIIVFDNTEDHYNSVIAVGTSEGRYDKRHLVPFGEYFPIPDFMRPLMDVLGTPYRDFNFGAPDQAPMQVNGHGVAVSVCFEDVFGADVRRDTPEAAYLVNVTNDAWFADSSAPHQHLVFSRLRAIENGRWMARTANTGISALIDPDGNVVARTQQFRQEVLRGTIEPRSGLTPYQRVGNVPLWVLSAGVLLAVGVLGNRRYS